MPSQVRRPNNSASVRSMTSPIVAPIVAGLKYGFDQPPCRNPPSVSSSGPPGACTPPSRLMNSLMMVRMCVRRYGARELIAGAAVRVTPNASAPINAATIAVRPNSAGRLMPCATAATWTTRDSRAEAIEVAMMVPIALGVVTPPGRTGAFVCCVDALHGTDGPRADGRRARAVAAVPAPAARAGGVDNRGAERGAGPLAARRRPPDPRDRDREPPDRGRAAVDRRQL